MMMTMMMTQAIKERPIPFQGWKVRRILEWDFARSGDMQTRRVMTPQPWRHGEYKYSPGIDKFIYRGHHRRGLWWGVPNDVTDCDPSPHTLFEAQCPYGAPGDRLWVREALHFERWYDDEAPSNVTAASRIWYAADPIAERARGLFNRGRKRPSIHMPRWASRLTLEVTGVRVGRVQNISEEDCYAEGISLSDKPYIEDLIGEYEWHPSSAYRLLWDTINATRGYPWEANPWVWVVAFKRVATNG